MQSVYLKRYRSSQMKIVLTLLLAAMAISGRAQTAGFNYQALIMDITDAGQANGGFSALNNPLIEEEVNLRFTIANGDLSEIHYIEEQLTRTDGNGLISVIVGEGIALENSFNTIVWDGNEKFLFVDINIVADGNEYIHLDSQKILYLPQTGGTSANAYNSGLHINGNQVNLGGVLTQPTAINTDSTNFLALKGLESVGTQGKRLLVVDDSGRIQQSNLVGALEQGQNVIFATSGQTEFSTPFPITNANYLNVFRNGVRIGFSVIDENTIALENGLHCFQDDEIRIVQYY